MAEKNEDKIKTKRKPKIKDIKEENVIDKKQMKEMKKELEVALEDELDQSEYVTIDVEPIKNEKSTEEVEELIEMVTPLDYDPKEVIKQEKKSNKVSAIIAILLLIIAITLIVVAFLCAVNFIKGESKNKTTAEDVQLQYTETIENKVSSLFIVYVINFVHPANILSPIIVVW